MNYAVFDTETCNALNQPLMYDIGWSIYNEFGDLLKRQSFVVAEVYCDLEELMQSAYYASKLPQYKEDLTNGQRILATLEIIKLAFEADLLMYNIKVITAHNAKFDYRAVQTTIRYITKSEQRYFLPYGVELWDTLRMARDTFKNDEDYLNFCRTNGFMTKHKTPRARFTAEVLYRYLSNNLEFVESHTGLEDTLIEKEILFECLRRNPNCEKSPWKS